MLTKPGAKQTVFYKTIKARSQELIQQVISANDYLLEKNNISFRDQEKQIQLKGITFNRTYYYYLKKGSRQSFSTIYPNIFSAYWNISLADLLYIGQEQSRKQATNKQ